jgi:hypothetical protein
VAGVVAAVALLLVGSVIIKRKRSSDAMSNLREPLLGDDE